MQASTLLALILLPLFAVALPLDGSDDSYLSSLVDQLTGVQSEFATILSLNPTQTQDPNSVLSLMQANSAALASAVGTQTLAEAEAFLVAAQAITALGTTQTQLAVIATPVAGKPVIVVSEVGGNEVITLATGTAGPAATTTFAGHEFLVSNAALGASTSNSLRFAGAAVVGSVIMGILSVV